MTCTAHTVNPYNTPDISPLPQACGTDAADVEGGRGGGERAACGARQQAGIREDATWGCRVVARTCDDPCPGQQA